jgi:hypothetical protein
VSSNFLPFLFVIVEVYEVQDVLSTVSVVIASVSVTLGVIYYILNRRNAQKREKLDLLMRIYMLYNTKEFHDNDSMLMSAEFDDYKDFVKRYGHPKGREPLHLALRQISGAYNQLGLLLRNRLIDIYMVQSVFEVERHWEKVRPIIEEARKALNDPTYLMYFEHLYDEWKASKEKTPLVA